MAVKRISFSELERYIGEGCGVSEAARRMHVSKGGVSRALKRYRLTVAKDMLIRYGPKISQELMGTVQKSNDEKISLMSETLRINRILNTELEYLQKEAESTTKEKRLKIQDQILKVSDRKLTLIKFGFEVMQTVSFEQEKREVYMMIAEGLKNVSPELQERFVSWLDEKGNAIPIEG